MLGRRRVLQYGGLCMAARHCTRRRPGRTLQTPPPPFLEIVRTDATPQDPWGGDPVMVSVVVRNPGKSDAGNVALLIRVAGTALQTLPLNPLPAGSERAHTLKVQAPGKAGAWCLDIALEPVKGLGNPLAKPRSVCVTVRTRASGTPSPGGMDKAKGGAAANQPVPSGPGGVSPAGQAGVLPPVAGGAAVNAVRIEQLSKAQFKALADEALIEIEGKKIRKADFVAEFKRRAAVARAGTTVHPSGLAAIQARIRAEEDAAIAASADEVRRRLAEIRAQGGDR